MKKGIIFLFLCFCVVPSFAGVKILDATFLAFLKKNYPDCINISEGVPVLDETCSSVLNAKTIDISGLNIKNVKGIEAFLNLQVLNCSNNQLMELPTLPANLQVLNCSNNQLLSLPPLLPSLSSLFCGQNKLEKLPTLPSALQYINCNYNKIKDLAALDANLQYLSCEGNDLVNLPDLPLKLTYLQTSKNKITKLPLLPIYLQFLDCSVNFLNEVSCLPPHLVHFNCSFNRISELSEIPKTLNYLNCTSNQLKKLPDSFLVSADLVEFHCGDNGLKSLPIFTSSLIHLNCEKNQLSELPELSPTLQILNCSFNELTELPILPSNLQKLSCSNNRISYLPSLPYNLEMLHCGQNPLVCLPYLPIRLQHLNTQSTQISCIPNAVPGLKLEPKLQICDGASPCAMRTANYADAFFANEKSRLDSIEIQFPFFIKAQKVHYHIFEDMAVMSGDILLGKSHQIYEQHAKRNPVWKNGVVNYQISPDFSQSAKNTIEQTIRYINTHSTLHVFFKPYMEDEANYIKIIPRAASYASYLGCMGGEQVLYLDSLPTFGMVLHTFGHALGLYHENQRADADKFVQVDYQNVDKRFSTCMEKLPYQQSSFYDYNSVMHNRAYAFSKNSPIQGQLQYLGANTLTAVKNTTRGEMAGAPAKPANMGQRNKFSNADIADINEIYKIGIEREMNGINLMYRFVVPNSPNLNTASEKTFDWLVINMSNLSPTEFKGSGKINEPFFVPSKAKGGLVVLYNDCYYYKLIQ